MPQHDAMEGELAWLQLSHEDAQLFHGAPVQKVDVAASIDEHTGEMAGVRIEVHNGIQDESVLSRAGNEWRMVLAPPCDSHLRPVHVLGLRWHDDVHLRFVPKVIPFVFIRSGEDVVLLDDSREVVITLVWLLGIWLMLVVLLTFSRLHWR
jgi:hypothetical protein